MSLPLVTKSPDICFNIGLSVTTSTITFLAFTAFTSLKLALMVATPFVLTATIGICIGTLMSQKRHFYLGYLVMSPVTFLIHIAAAALFSSPIVLITGCALSGYYISAFIYELVNIRK
jgi:hypothetical protein